MLVSRPTEVVTPSRPKARHHAGRLATLRGQGAVCDTRGGLPSTPLATSTAASTDHQVGTQAAAAATCSFLPRPNVQAIPAAFSMGRAAAAATMGHGHENMPLLNDVRKSDGSQVVAARTDFFGRTNHACWEQAANDAAAHVELAQTADVRSIVGTIVSTSAALHAHATQAPSPVHPRDGPTEWRPHTHLPRHRSTATRTAYPPTVRANRTAPRIPHQPQFQPSCSPPPALPAIYPPPNPHRPSPNTCAPTRLRPCLASAIPRQRPSDLPRPEAFFIRATSFLPSPKLLCSSCRLLFDLDLLSP